jgi:hypothetical protein
LYSCSVQPAGRFGIGVADALGAGPDGDGSGVAGTGVGVGVATAADANAHDGAAVAWQAAIVAAIPATLTAPAVRRNPRRDTAGPGGSTGSTGDSAGVSTGRLRLA